MLSFRVDSVLEETSAHQVVQVGWEMTWSENLEELKNLPVMVYINNCH